MKKVLAVIIVSIFVMFGMVFYVIYSVVVGINALTGALIEEQKEQRGK